jgi:hypothetical protein
MPDNDTKINECLERVLPSRRDEIKGRIYADINAITSSLGHKVMFDWDADGDENSGRAAIFVGGANIIDLIYTIAHGTKIIGDDTGKHYAVLDDSVDSLRGEFARPNDAALFARRVVDAQFDVDPYGVATNAICEALMCAHNHRGEMNEDEYARLGELYRLIERDGDIRLDATLYRD